jgi:hypothetical protein
MARASAHLPASRRRLGPSRGFTLVELVVGSALSLLVVTALSGIALQQIRIADRGYSSAMAQRGFRKLSDLMRSESREACLMRTDSDFRIPPGDSRETRCTPEAATSCSTTAGKDLRLLFPILNTATNQIDYGVVRYYLVDSELRRDGPLVSANGSLVPGSTLNGQRVLTNVARFVPTVAADCQSVTITIVLAIPGTNQVSRTISLAAGPRLMVY